MVQCIQLVTNTCSAKAVPIKGQKRPNVPEKPLPQGYICHRCQQKGHWIYDCPTNDDPTFVPKPKLKKTTGIPRSFLEKVEKVEDDEDEDDPTMAKKGYMIDADGNRVRVKTDTVAWEKEQARQKASAAKKEAAAEENKELQERGLECSIDNRLFDVPTKTPCCQKTYCAQCIEDALVNNDLVCPNCGTENVLLDDLRPDTEMAMKIKAYRDEKTAEAEAAQAERDAKTEAEAEAIQAEAEKAAKEAEAAAEKLGEEKTDVKPNVASPKESANSIESEEKAENAKSTTPPHSVVSAKSTQMVRTGSTESISKKRPAEEELKNDRIPTAPAAMRKQQEQTRAQDTALPKFLEDMEKLSQGGMPMFTSQASQPNQIPQMATANMPMMGNPMMGNMNPMMMGMPGVNMMNYGMNQNQMNMMNMNNPNMGYDGYNNGYQQGYQQNGNWQNQNQNRQYGNNWNNRGGYQGQYRQYNNQYNNNNNNSNNNEHVNYNQNRGGFRQGGFDKDHPNEEGEAYFRQPVNPNRHQQRRRLRPSEYTELG
jgi:protein MPE1